MEIKLIDLNRQYQEIASELETEVVNILKSTSYIMGGNVRLFEKEFSDYLQIRNSISVGNGTDALIIALNALGIGPGDEVITTPFTFFATAESIARVGATPVFVDVKLDTYNIDEDLIEEKITSKTKAILPVHIFGQPCNMDKINEIAKKHNLYVVEDACQAIGSEYNDQKIGTVSDIACFSFFPTKNLGCAGDGGMIVTNNDELADVCKGLRAHGSGEYGEKAYNYINGIKSQVDQENSQADNTIYNPKKYYNYIVGYNSRLDEIQAAILRIKLRKIDKYNDLRIKNADFYNQKLNDTNLILPFTDYKVKHVFHLYILQSDKREHIIKELKDKGIATGVYYPIPLHLQKAFAYLGYKQGDCPNAEYLSHRTFAIPMFPELSEEEKEYIVQNIKEVIDNE